MSRSFAPWDIYTDIVGQKWCSYFGDILYHHFYEFLCDYQQMRGTLTVSTAAAARTCPARVRAGGNSPPSPDPFPLPWPQRLTPLTTPSAWTFPACVAIPTWPWICPHPQTSCWEPQNCHPTLPVNILTPLPNPPSVNRPNFCGTVYHTWDSRDMYVTVTILSHYCSIHPSCHL